MASPGLAAWRHQLPTGCVAQFDGDLPEMQVPATAGGEMDLADGILGGQTQSIGRGAATGDDGLAPKRGERSERRTDTRRAQSETGLDRTHVDTLADAHQPPGASEACQCLVHCRTLAQVEESGRTDGCRLGQDRDVLHDAFRKAGHGPAP